MLSSYASINPDDDEGSDEEEELVKSIISTREKFKNSVTKSFEADAVDTNGKEDKTFKGCGPYLLLIALSVHSVFEGIAIGLEEGLWPTGNIILAICIHKWAAAMAIGISFAKSEIAINQIYKLCMLITGLS